MEDKNIVENGKFVIALSRSLRTIHKKSEDLFRSYQLTTSQFAVMEALCHKGALSVGELTDAVLSTSGNMTVVIRNLEQNGLVIRTVNSSDRRSFVVQLTQKGQSIIEKVFTKHMEFVQQSLSPLTFEEKETVINILHKLR